MFRLVIPSAEQLILALSSTGLTDIADLNGVSSIMDCSLNHIWFYVLDEKLDGIHFPAQNFMMSIERGFQRGHMDEEFMSPQEAAFISNYDHITRVVHKVTNMMSLNLDNVLARTPELRNFSNRCSYLNIISTDGLVITFFNNISEKEAYVRQIQNTR